MTWDNEIVPTDGKRGPLKEPRIGTLQSEILSKLSKSSTDLSFREILAELNDYFILQEKIWIPSIYARHLYKMGDYYSAATVLYQAITPLLREIIRNNMYHSTIDPQKIADSAYSLLDTAEAIFRKWRMEESNLATSETQYEILLNCARNAIKLAEIVKSQEKLQSKYLLPEGARETYKMELNKTYASLSRALKVLRSRGLIIDEKDDSGSARIRLTDEGMLMSLSGKW